MVDAPDPPAAFQLPNSLLECVRVDDATWELRFAIEPLMLGRYDVQRLRESLKLD